MVMASKARELDSEADRLTALRQATIAAETEQTQSLSSLEVEHEKLTSRTYELDGELRQNQNILNQTALELDRAENRISFNHQRRSEIDTRTVPNRRPNYAGGRTDGRRRRARRRTFR